jgi:predicted Fe-Mo cluster-binding NifX family protein
MTSIGKIVAVACETDTGLESSVCGHFGHTPFFLVAYVADGKIVTSKVITSPGHGEGGCSMPGFIQGLGAKALVVGGLGGGAAARLDSMGIEVIGGVSGKAGDALSALVAGNLTSGDSTCHGHGGDGHVCSHHQK